MKRNADIGLFTASSILLNKPADKQAKEESICLVSVSPS